MMPPKKKPRNGSSKIMRELKIRKNIEDRLENKGIKKKKPRIGEGLSGVKRKARAKSAEELYDSKRKSFRGSKIENFKLGGVAKTLINKYKAKLKNEKEDYGLYSKQDYSDVIKKAEKTKKRIQRNRKVAGAVGGTTAATVVASNVKDKK